MGTPNTWLRVGRAAVAVALVLLVSRLVLDVAGMTSVGDPVWPLAVLVGCVLVVAVLVVSADPTGESTSGTDTGDGDGSTEDGDGDDDDDEGINSVWNAIPPWQYAGRHAESGGITRGEQEQVLAEIQMQAEELERENETRNQ